MDKYRLQEFIWFDMGMFHTLIANNPINPKFAQLSERGIEQIQQLAHQLQVVNFEKFTHLPCLVRFRQPEILKRYQNEYKRHSVILMIFEK